MTEQTRTHTHCVDTFCFVVFAAVSLCVSGCGTNPALGSSCSPAELGECTCPSGGLGTRICSSDGEWSHCMDCRSNEYDAGLQDLGNESTDSGAVVEDAEIRIDGCILATRYLDEDADGFGSLLEGPITACLDTPGYVGNGLDCADQDARANPGASEFQSVPVMGLSASGPFDFDCDGQEALESTYTATCETSGYECIGEGAGNAWRAETAPRCGQMGTWLFLCSVGPRPTFGCAPYQEARAQKCL